MTQYCTCPTCTQSPARPASMTQAQMERIAGARVVMQPGWVLAHWSGATFTDMASIEIHNFVQAGDGHCLRVGASFYLYQGQPPQARPQQLTLMGLGGGNRYTIDSVVGNTLNVFYKGSAAANPAEVTVILGCGGTISFDAQRQATGANTNDTRPRLTIS